MRQVLRPGALGRPRGIRWRGRWERGSGWGIYVYPRLIHVNVWQNPLQYCKVISLQQIKINGKKRVGRKVVADADSIHLDSLGDTLVLPSFLPTARFHTWELSLKTLKGHSTSRCQMTDRRGYYYPSSLVSLIFFTVPPTHHGDAPVSHSGSCWIVCSSLIHFSASCNFQRNYLHFYICLRISFWGNVNEDKLIMSINF